MAFSKVLCFPFLLTLAIVTLSFRHFFEKVLHVIRHTRIKQMSLRTVASGNVFRLQLFNNALYGYFADKTNFFLRYFFFLFYRAKTTAKLLIISMLNLLACLCCLKMFISPKQRLKINLEGSLVESHYPVCIER